MLSGVDRGSKCRGLSDNALNNRKDGTGRLLLSNTIATWEPFSNDNQGNQPYPAANSLEKLHGNIHWSLGGGAMRGNMTSPPVAGSNVPTRDAYGPLLTRCSLTAFDPFFFIHHSQTDRLLSLWMAMHPDAWVTASKEYKGTWTIKEGGAVSAATRTCSSSACTHTILTNAMRSPDAVLQHRRRPVLVL